MKAQAALEFLTTYAWAILVILITIGTLYYFGIFDFTKFQKQQCIFGSQFECVDFAFQSSEIRFRLVNNVGEDIQVENANVTNDGANPLSCTPPGSFAWSSEEEVDIAFSACSGGGFLVGEYANADITLIYYAASSPSQTRHTIKGTINAKVI